MRGERLRPVGVHRTSSYLLLFAHTYFISFFPFPSSPTRSVSPSLSRLLLGAAELLFFLLSLLLPLFLPFSLLFSLLLFDRRHAPVRARNSLNGRPPLTAFRHLPLTSPTLRLMRPPRTISIAFTSLFFSSLFFFFFGSPPILDAFSRSVVLHRSNSSKRPLSPSPFSSLSFTFYPHFPSFLLVDNVALFSRPHLPPSFPFPFLLPFPSLSLFSPSSSPSLFPFSFLFFSSFSFPASSSIFQHARDFISSFFSFSNSYHLHIFLFFYTPYTVHYYLFYL